MLNLKIGGVPEHFNYPWYITLKNKEYTKEGINLRWQDFDGGTGAMNKALRSGEIDIAVILLEGVMKDIINGNPSKIVQTYIKSPLVWGIHVSASSSFNKMKDLEHAKIAISRFGSGSHLMAIINAHNQGWDIDSLEFVVVGNIKGGIEALSNGTADYFMWEHFTTKPYVDNGIFRRIDNCPTPWPCFVIAVREETLEKHPEEIKKVLNIINKTTTNFKEIQNIDMLLAERYQLKIEDIQKWLSITQWNDKQNIDEKLIAIVQEKLLHFGVIEKPINVGSFIKKM